MNKLFTVLAICIFAISCAHKNKTYARYPAPAPTKVEQDILNKASMPETKLKKQASKYKKATRGLASTHSKGFFDSSNQGCQAYEGASKDSNFIKNIAGGKQLWAEKEANGWYKIYLKKSVAFVESNCFN